MKNGGFSIVVLVYQRVKLVFEAAGSKKDRPRAAGPGKQIVVLRAPLLPSVRGSSGVLRVEGESKALNWLVVSTPLKNISQLA